jgi:dephospho-CoA kinase
MKVFIIGATKSGKTTLAEKLSKKYNFKHIKASALIRDIFPKNESSPSFIPYNFEPLSDIITLSGEEMEELLKVTGTKI